jgi:WD40 repeat protein
LVEAGSSILLPAFLASGDPAMQRLAVLPLLLLITLSVAAAEPKDKPVLVLDAQGHTDSVMRVLFTPDGKELLSTSEDGTVRIWDVKSGETIRVLRLPAGVRELSDVSTDNFSAALSPDGRFLAVSALSAEKGQHWVYQIALAKNQIVRVFKGHSKAIRAVAFSPDGTLLAAGGGGAVRIWDIATGQEKFLLAKHQGIVSGVAFSPDGKHLASASQDHNVRVWSVETGKLEHLLEGHSEPVRAVGWSADGKTIASCGVDQTIRLWVPDGTLKKTIKQPGTSTCLTFLPDGSELLIGRSGKLGCSIRSTDSGKQRLTFTSHTDAVYGVAVTADGKLAASAGLQGEELFVWDTKSGQVLRRLGGTGRRVINVAWGRDGRSIAWQNATVAGDREQRMSLSRSFRLADLEFGPTPADDEFQGAQTSLGSLSLEKRGKLEVVVKRGTEVVSTLKPPGELAINSLTFLGGDRAAVAKPNGLYLFDATNGKLVRFFMGLQAVASVAPSPNHRYLVTASDQVIRIWTPDRAEPLLSLFVARDDWIAWTPEGYYAASPGGERLMGWQISNGPEALATFYPASQFRKSLYRPDLIRRVLETGSVERALEAADREQGRKTALTEVNQVLPPTVAITAPPPGTRLTNSKLVVKATAQSTAGHPVTLMQLLLDGRPYQGDKGTIAFPKSKPGAAEGTWTVQLPPGKHELSVRASSAVSSGVSEAVEATYKPPDDKDLRPSLYVLAIGINAYPGDFKLGCAVKDAQDLTKTFEDKSKALYRQVLTRLVLDKEATRDGILKGFAWLKGQMKPHDVAVIFYAGHGHRDKDHQFFLLPIGFDAAQLTKTAVSGDELKNMLVDLPAGKVLLLLDACHSGAIGGRSKASLTDDLVRELADDDCGVVVMCAAMGREESREDTDYGHGLFTLALIEGLSGKADLHREGIVRLNGLDSYVDYRVTELSKDEQHPVTAKPTTIRSFALSMP